MSSFSALVQALEELSNGTNHQSIESRGLLHQVCSYPFVLSLVLFEQIFASISSLLQAEQICYASAATCINATKVALSSMRSDGEWKGVWDKARSLASENNISVNTALLRHRPQRSRTTPRHLDDSIIDTTVITSRETPIDEYKTQVYYGTIDVILNEMGARFSKLNLSLLSALDALVPTSDIFLHLPTLSPFLSHYRISEEAVKSEVPVLRAKNTSDPTLPLVHQTL